MYLAIDIGNTLTKFFLFENDQQIDFQKLSSDLFFYKIDIIIKKYPRIEAIIFSDVKGIARAFKEKYSERIKLIMVDSNLNIPFSMGYKSPKSLGADRIVLVSSASFFYPNENILLIDIGSCITYDFIDNKKKYWGGAISPGFEMRYKSLNKFTGNLPLLGYKPSHTPEGFNTASSIHSGIYFAILDEIKARIDYYENKYSQIKVILTGGDLNKLPKTFKNTIFTNSKFIANGMLHLLKLNID